MNSKIHSLKKSKHITLHMTWFHLFFNSIYSQTFILTIFLGYARDSTVLFCGKWIENWVKGTYIPTQILWCRLCFLPWAYIFYYSKTHITGNDHFNHFLNVQSMVFNTFTVLCSHHYYLVPQHSHHCRRKAIPIKQSLPIPLSPESLPVTNLLSLWICLSWYII